MNKTELTVKDSALSFLISFLLCQIAVVIITCVALVIYKLCGFDMTEFSSFLNSGLGYMISAFALYVTMLLVFFFYNKKREIEIFKKVKTNKVLFYILIALASFLCLYPIVTCVDSLLVKCGAKINTLPYPLNTKNYFISILSLVIAPAVCEELMFRGIIFKGLKKHGKIFSITISALMFSIYHLAISQTLYPLLIGLLLGVIMYYENNIYYCIAVHLTNNFTSLTLSYFKINLAFNHWTYILLAIILAIAFISTIVYFSIKNNKSNEKQPLTKQDKMYLIISLVVMSIFWISANFS